ncbi:MAG: transposase [Oligoflexales bacterium]|nr:transposase [Oligoflexales bacterium]
MGSTSLFEKLFNKNLTLLTPIKRNMKNRLLPLEDKIMLRKRSLIETVNDILKNMCQIEHTRHRSPLNFLANLLSALAAYTFLPKKPSLRETSHEVEQYLDRNMQLAI